jgi:hypothetical protein
LPPHPRKRPRTTPPPVAVALERLEALLAGDARHGVLEEAAAAGSFAGALLRLRTGMEQHALGIPRGRVSLRGVVGKLDRRVRREGFHVLRAWDPERRRFSADEVPVLLLDHFDRERAGRPGSLSQLAILLDHYILHLLALVAMDAWGDPDPDGVMDRVTGLLGLLQGPGGSGHQFLALGESLLVLAVSHFHPKEVAYDRFTDRVRTLNLAHRTAFAAASAAALGGHLRWGAVTMYRGDALRMREDNRGDYPWLLFSLATLLDALDGAAMDGGLPRETLVTALLNGLSADPTAFGGTPPPALEPYREEYERCVASLRRHAPYLGEEFRQRRPSAEGYSPVAFHFNFPNNALVASLMVALRLGAPFPVPLAGLLLGVAPSGSGPDDLRMLARALADYAAGQRARLVFYDPERGSGFVEQTLQALGGEGP